MTDTCGCCEGIEQITPITIINRPGLSALVYRVGTHATFLETMLARLSSLSIPLGELGPLLPPGADPNTPVYPLQALTTRSTGDPAIALLDAWAVVGDIFTFYQERIANEGYLRTATHRRSILELARLVGYKLGPGVASSTYLAYTLQSGYNTLIPAGSRAQNIPTSGQLPQSFETSEDLQARAAWSNLQSRMSVPEYITQLDNSHIDINTPDGAVYLDGTSTNLKPHDPVLFVFGDSDGQQLFAHVQEVTPHAAEKYTSVSFPTTLTPLVFLRNILDLVDRYLDLQAFGVNPSDPGVEEILPLLELGKTLLELGKVYLQQVAAGNLQTADFSEIGDALYLIGVLILWLERLIDLMISNGSPRDIRSTLEALNLVSNEIEDDLGSVKNSSVKQLLQSAHSASQLFLQQVRQPDLSSPLQTAITLLQPFTDSGQHGPDVSSMAQTVLQALQEIAPRTNLDLVTVLQAVQNALSNLDLTNPDAIKLVQSVESALEPFTSQGAIVDLVTVLVTVRQTLSTLQLTDQNVIALVLASLTEIDQLLQTVRAEIDTLLQTVNDALDSFLTWVTNVFATNSSIHRTLTRSMRLLKGIPRTLVYASIHIPTIRNVLPASSRIFAITSMFSRGKDFPPDSLQDTLGTWCDVHQNAAINKTIGLANWVGALLTEVKSLASSLPGIGQLLGNVCTPAVISGLGALTDPLLQPPNLQPPSSARLKRSVTSSFARTGDIAPQLLTTFQPQLAPTLYTAYSHAQVTKSPKLKEFDALRVKAVPFGSNAPKQAVTTEATNIPQKGQNTFTTNYTEWPIAESTFIDIQVSPYDTSNPLRQTLQLTFRQGGISQTANVGQDSTGTTTNIPYSQTVPFPSNNPVIKITVDVTATSSHTLASIAITSDTGLSLTLTPDSSGAWNVDIDPNNTYPIDMEYDAKHNLNISVATLIASKVLDLDARYDHIVPETWVVIEGASSLNPPVMQKAIMIQNVETIARADYGMSAKVTRLTLYEPWLTPADLNRSPLDLSLYRGITVYAQSEMLSPADVPLTDDIGKQDYVELNDLYDGLQSGRWMVVSGELTDIPNTSGVTKSELMMLQSVTQDPHTMSDGTALPGDTIHTTLHFATSLKHTYKRSTVTINGNVVPATQGETQNQILGSGSAGTPMQQFSLAKSPLTYIPAVTPTGEESTLQVFVNNVRWHEVDNLDAAQSTDRVYITQTDNQDKVTITFGNGVHGARLPTGNENVKAIYRTGIGTSGNVDIGKITQLVSKPLGVKAVNNPIAATGGAERETRDQARANVPLAATSLGHIVSVQDYADFARTFAGIGKASAAYLSDGYQQVVHLTIVGQDNIPIDPTSSLYQSLLQSLHTFGDPSTPLILALADVKLLIISARVSIQADYLFDDVAAALRSALLDAFGFERRDLGQPVFQSEVLNVMQRVAGVAYVDLDVLDAITQKQLTNALQQIQADALKDANTGSPTSTPPDLATLLQLKDLPVVPSVLARLDSQHPGNILPAELVYLSPDVQDTLILNELTALTFKPPSHKHHYAHLHRR